MGSLPPSGSLYVPEHLWGMDGHNIDVRVYIFRKTIPTVEECRTGVGRPVRCDTADIQWVDEASWRKGPWGHRPQWLKNDENGSNNKK